MLDCFVTKSDQKITPITLIQQSHYSQWLKMQTPYVQAWLVSTGYKHEPSAYSLVPGEDGSIAEVIVSVSDSKQFWIVGALAVVLPEGVYELNADDKHFAIAWGLGAYQFCRYRDYSKKPSQLLITNDVPAILNTVQSIYLVRDLVNTPADDMGPTELAEVATDLAKEFDGHIEHIVGEDLLTQNYTSIHTVGRASDDAPRLIDLRWGESHHPKVTLVGKGVCFDTGGLDLKNSSGMLLMKKDMGGAAHVLGLARMIMQANLPIALRVLIPAVENAVGGNAYRPGDVIKSRKGITIEIGNTDAEGRVVLADALTEAVAEKPELLIDIATLTGAARVALGTDLPAVFSNNDALVKGVLTHAAHELDPIWHMPLFAPYREALNSHIADINNNTADGYAGAITAALFLKEFVPDTIPWLHFDLMAWNLRSRPGRPQGGEAMALRGIFSYLEERFKR